MQQHIINLENKITLLYSKDTENTPVHNTAQAENTYYTDEDEPVRETDWILKERKRSNKKRKAGSSSDTPLQNQRDRTVTQKQVGIENRSKKNGILKKQHIPPSIIVSGIETFGVLKEMIKEITTKECKYTSHNNNVWKLNVPDSDTYRATTNELTKRKIQWHTYEDKTERPIKVMAKGLHPSCEESDIVLVLINKGFQILEAKNIIKKETIEKENGERVTQSKGLQLFMLTFHKEENIEKIFTIKSIIGIGVKIEPLRRNTNLIPQCKRYQSFGHTQGYCQKEFACVKCAGKHSTKGCTFRRDQKSKCINCRGDHPANYRGCPVAKEQQARRNKLVNARQQRQNKARVEEKSNINMEKSEVENKQKQNTKSYAQIVKNARKKEDNTNNDALMLILLRLDEQDKSIRTLIEKISVLESNNKKPSVLKEKK